MSIFRVGPALVIFLLLALAFPAAASPPAWMTDFFSDLHTLQADFEQQVLDSNGQLLQSSRGHMWIQRPGRFRWNYETPYRQQLVADGNNYWSYDEDLEQVTVQPATDVLSSTPAMLLSGEQPLETLFIIEETGTRGDEQYVLLTPRSDDSNIVQLRLVFVASRLHQINAEDKFGNDTTFTFTQVERNLVLDESVFRFVPPVGADVVGDYQ